MKRSSTFAAAIILAAGLSSPSSAATFGAIAMTGDGITHVYSGEFPTAAAARKAAMEKCVAAVVKRYGRAVREFTGCVVWVSFGNGCGAVTNGGALAGGAGETLAAAKEDAIRRCETRSKRCRIAEAECAGD
jgi:hypothetical protein